MKEKINLPRRHKGTKRHKSFVPSCLRGKIFFFLILITLSSCNKKIIEPPKATPSDLNVVTAVNHQLAGEVMFEATASRVDHFLFDFGDGSGDPMNSKDGKVTHTYTASGSYDVVVSAVSVDNVTIEKTVTVDIQL